jgi:hypothetical protein
VFHVSQDGEAEFVFRDPLREFFHQRLRIERLDTLGRNRQLGLIGRAQASRQDQPKEDKRFKKACHPGEFPKFVTGCRIDLATTIVSGEQR